MLPTVNSRSKVGVVIGDRVHILIPPAIAHTRFHLSINEEPRPYCCMCPAHAHEMKDSKDDIQKVVEQAVTQHGVKTVVVRYADRAGLKEICGLPILDPETILGEVGEGATVVKIDRP